MRGHKKTELCKLNINTGNYVCQDNDLIMLKQSLSLNAIKLIRAAMMQIVRSDTELEAYYISVTDMASLLNTSASNLYRDMDTIINNITDNPIKFIDSYGERTIIPWVNFCKYRPDVGVMIQLNSLLKPYLLNLRERYTQYTYETIITMKSVYSIRIFEILISKIKTRVLPKEGTDTIITLSELREALDLTTKYPRYTNLRQRIIEPAIDEINRCTLYSVSLKQPVKNGVTIAITFHINMQYHTPHTTKEEN